MKALSILLLLVVLPSLSPSGVTAQIDSSLPSPGSYGVSFSLPSGGGAGFGIRRMLSQQTSAGLDVQLGLSWQDGESGGVAQDSRTHVSVVVSPDLRLYRRLVGPVIPFLEVDAHLSYARSPDDAWSMGGGCGVGLGVEWLPLAGMSVSGSTGINAVYGHQESVSSSSDNVSLGVFRSELKLNLYF